MSSTLSGAKNIEVRTASRLHFGLLEICPDHPHCYGGLGLMIDAPESILSARLGECSDPDSLPIDAPKYWRLRAIDAVQQWRKVRRSSVLPVAALRVCRAPEAHVGLGSGTQFACSVSGLLSAAECMRSLSLIPCGLSHIVPSTEVLALESGRGKRSHIGLEGFLHGGMIFDRGQMPVAAPGIGLAPRTQSVFFPSQWRIVTACDGSYSGDSGHEEKAIFDVCSRHPNPNRDTMLRLVQSDLLPALDACDWSAAGRAVGHYGALAGEVFRSTQGGIYRSQGIADAIADLHGLGVYGSGQSSWGPTLFAIVADEDQAQWVAARLTARMPASASVRIARAAGPAMVYASSSSECA